MKPVKIAFFDIDGTLASNKDRTLPIMERIPSSTMKALRLLEEKGITPVIATGRGRMAVVPFMAELGMDSYIAANGLSVNYKGEEIYKKFLQGPAVEQVVAQLIDLSGVSILLETAIGNVLCKDEFKRIIPYAVDKSDSLSDLGSYDTYHITVAGKQLKERVHIDYPGLKARMVAPDVMNIFYEEVSKATGIERLLSILGIDKSEAIAFGDEENDLEMFEAVGISVAMGNGVAALKEKATYVTSHVDEDGIWNACKHFGLL